MNTLAQDFKSHKDVIKQV